MDKVLIKDLRVQAIIGINPWERETPQEILINLEIYTDLTLAGETDDIADCINYDQTAAEILNHTQQVQRFTVEALAHDIAEICLAKPNANSVRVKVEKPNAVPYAARVGVEIKRSRKD